MSRSTIRNLRNMLTLVAIRRVGATSSVAPPNTTSCKHNTVAATLIWIHTRTSQIGGSRFTYHMPRSVKSKCNADFAIVIAAYGP